MNDKLLSLKWNNHKTSFFENLKNLREKSNYTDATLAVEGKFYPVHKLVLSTCSEYFSDIFERTPCKSPVIVLKDVRSQDIEALLNYMYLGEVNVNQNDLASLLKTAECLRIKGLPVPDGDSTKLYKNSASSHNDGHQDSRPPKKRRYDSSIITPHVASPVTSTQRSATVLVNSAQTHILPPHSSFNTKQDESPILKVEMDDSEEQKERFRRENNYEGGAGYDQNPDVDYGSDITKTEHDVEVEMDDVLDKEKKSKRENYMGSVSCDRDPGGDYGSDFVKTDHGPEKYCNTSLTELSLQKNSVVVTIEIGHRATVRQIKKKHGFSATHDWEIFVQGHGGARLEAFVEKVVFLLHRSFKKPKRVIKQPPFCLAEKGYGSFKLPIEIYFKTNEGPRQHRLEYDLYLQPLNESPYNNVIKERLTFLTPSDDFRSKLLEGGGELECSDKTDSSAGNDQTVVAHPSSGTKIKPYGAQLPSNSQQDTQKHKTDMKKIHCKQHLHHEH